MEKKICRLCLQTISGDYEAIEQSFNETLKMNMNISKEAVKCIDCADNLEVFLKFKSACDYMKDRTDLKEDINLITITEEDHLTSPMESIKCCFCTKTSEREGLTSLNESKEHTFLMNVLKEHIPKLNLHIREELLTCDTCLDGLQSVSSFLVNCSDVEQKITEYTEIKGTDDKGQIDLEDVQQLIIDPTIKLEIDSKDVTELKGECGQFQEEYTLQAEAELKHEEEMDNPELFIKTEDIDIKSEEANCNSIQEQKTDTEKKHKTYVNRRDSTNKNCAGMTTYTCEICPYTTKRMGLLKKHKLTHKGISEVTKFKCQMCEYETNHKHNLYQHRRLHKSPSEVPVLKCNLCPYETIRRNHFKQHELIHKSPSEVTMFECDLCPYKALRQNKVERHKLTHKSTSEITMFKCDLCPYEGKHQLYLKRHKLRHKSTLELSVLKCEFCSYETKVKEYLTQHKRLHKINSGKSAFKCDLCSYEAKQKKYLIRHQLIHKSTSDITMFKCELCSYETKHKKNLKRHKLNHENTSDVTMFKCKECSYETKHRDYLRRHKLTHESPLDVKMVKCEFCSYTAKGMIHLKKHNLLHKSASDKFL